MPDMRLGKNLNYYLLTKTTEWEGKMSAVRKLSGQLVATGPSMSDGAHNNAEPATAYDYIRIEAGGEEIFLERVIVPAFLDSLLTVGTAYTLYVAEVRIPKLFGSKPLYFVYAVDTNGKVRKAIEQTQRCLRGVKTGSIKLFGAGFVLLIAWGFGVLFWIQAFRLLNVTLPIDAMQRELI